MVIARRDLVPETDIHVPGAQWVIFSDETDIRLLKLLKKGFRHCFMVMQQDGRWVLIDPRSNKTDIALLPHPATFNFPRYFSEQGKTVIKVPLTIKTPHKVAPVFPVSCVETVKRLIGVHQRWVMTPYQLYRHLTKIQQGKGDTLKSVPTGTAFTQKGTS